MNGVTKRAEKGISKSREKKNKKQNKTHKARNQLCNWDVLNWALVEMNWDTVCHTGLNGEKVKYVRMKVTQVSENHWGDGWGLLSVQDQSHLLQFKSGWWSL